MINKIHNLIDKFNHDRKNELNLIASENYVSKDVLLASGSKLTNKYAEGYPGRRYYYGCENVDEIENIAIEEAKKLFNCNFANVQPHSGSQANFAVLTGLLEPGQKILSLDLKCGGHLTHGYQYNASGKYFNVRHYFLDKKTNLLDYDQIEKIAKEFKPNLIIAGFSSYPRSVDFSKISKIAKKYNSYFLADIAHISGLIIAKKHQSPFKYADIVTTTTHKTLRGPRGGLILSNNEELFKKVERGLFPFTQGGPLMHIIAAKAISFSEAQKDSYRNYIEQLLKNIKVCENYFKKEGIEMTTGGTDTHLLLINTLKSYNLTGKQAADLLSENKIIVNKNLIPFDTQSPTEASGIRIGSPYLTSRGLLEKDFLDMAIIIHQLLRDKKINVESKSMVDEIIKTLDNE